MKDNRPSRKESKAQSNIREYLQDIAMGYTTHVKTSTVGMWRNRYRDFRKSEKQAWKDYELLFEYDPITVNEEPKVDAECFKKASKKLKRINVAGTVIEVEAPEMQDVVVMERYNDVLVLNSEQADIINRWDRITDQITTWLLVGSFAVGCIIGIIGQYLYMVAR